MRWNNFGLGVAIANMGKLFTLTRFVRPKMLLLSLGLLTAALLPAADGEMPPKNELAFQLGGFVPVSRGNSQQRLDLGSGLALQADYGRLILGGPKAALYYEVHLLANPLRDVASDNRSVTRDVATLFLTPGLRVKFRTMARVSPYLSAGGGLTWFEQSTQQLNGNPNTADRELFQGAFDFGGGADIPVWRFVALRGEVRDFITGSPNYNVPAVRGAQNNVVVGAGFVIRWH